MMGDLHPICYQQRSRIDVPRFIVGDAVYRPNRRMYRFISIYRDLPVPFADSPINRYVCGWDKFTARNRGIPRYLTAGLRHPRCADSVTVTKNDFPFPSPMTRPTASHSPLSFKTAPRSRRSALNLRIGPCRHPINGLTTHVNPSFPPFLPSAISSTPSEA